MANPWWVVTYVAQGTGAAQLGTVIVQAPNRNAARAAAVKEIPSTDSVGAARGPYSSHAAAAAGGIATGGSKTGKQVPPVKGTSTSSTPPSGSGQVSATPSNLASSACILTFPKLTVLNSSIGPYCMLGKTEARAIVGAGLFVPAILFASLGIILLAAYGLNHTGAGRAAKQAGKTVAKASTLLA